MKYKIIVCIFAFYNLALLRESSAVYNEDITRVYWDGVGFFVNVSRQAIQRRLNEWHQANSDLCDAPRLYLPNYPVFPGLMDEDQHPIYIDWGNMTFQDFEGCGDNRENPVVYGIEVNVNIPLLTTDPDGPPAYSLALAKFYERNRGDIPKPNILYPYIPADKLTVDDFGASIQIGNEEMIVSFERFRHPCTPPKDVVVHEFDGFVKGDLHLGTLQPHFDYCLRHPSDNHFCRTTERLRCTVSRLSPNLCQMWNPLDVYPCATSVEVVRATDFFRRFMLFGDEDPISVVSSETFYGNFTVGLKYPCLD